MLENIVKKKLKTVDVIGMTEKTKNEIIDEICTDYLKIFEILHSYSNPAMDEKANQEMRLLQIELAAKEIFLFVVKQELNNAAYAPKHVYKLIGDLEESEQFILTDEQCNALQTAANELRDPPRLPLFPNRMLANVVYVNARNNGKDKQDTALEKLKDRELKRKESTQEKFPLKQGKLTAANGLFQLGSSEKHTKRLKAEQGVTEKLKIFLNSALDNDKKNLKAKQESLAHLKKFESLIPNYEELKANTLVFIKDLTKQIQLSEQALDQLDSKSEKKFSKSS